ncbi:MAG: substrate-binding domain-containing protein [Hyphomicrobiales bacterium]|nr:substrate-binding domain-containing protein [Hyphomicrobiales bacterium]MCY4048343.1 substrate-binding domain-containing protein [Hyphomicrobiales bacterium]MCY4053892.1 substrate-binding domain-containing protein [Hyphomicrobiales bacterium]
MKNSLFPTKWAVASGFALIVLAGFDAGESLAERGRIHIVGSSTVFPFSAAVSEYFGKSSDFPTPLVESTGSGGGLKLFCAGAGESHPDITNASRRIKSSEVEACAKNGVDKVTEVKIGFDGIVLANSRESSTINVTLRQIWLALAKEVPEGGVDGANLVANPYKNWSDIDSSLPNVAIEVLGPPPTSGTRDAFVEIAMEGGCKSFDSIKAMSKSDKNAYKTLCHTVREDGAWIDAGENDNLIVQKLLSNPEAFGVFGFSFLDQNQDRLHGSYVGGVEPSFENIASGDYSVSRSLFFYVKNAHVDIVPGLREYVSAFTDEDAWGEEGYLVDKGLIPLPEEEREAMGKQARALKPMSF